MTGQLLIAQPPIQVMPGLAEAVGFNEAALLQIVHYWLNPRINPNLIEGVYWVKNLVVQLQGRFFFWDGATIGYMVAGLEQSGFLVRRDGTTPDGSPALYHTIDYGRLEELVPVPDDLFMVHSSQNAPSELEPMGPPQDNSRSQPPFSARIQEKGKDLYVMAVKDQQHYLACDLPLEIQEVAQGRPAAEGSEADPLMREAVCHFPRIATEAFRKFTGNDKTLYGVLMTAFQLNLMKQLLLFSRTHRADRLVIFADDTDEADFRIYREFLEHIDEAFLPEDEEAEAIIPASREAVDAWMAFMAQVGIKLQQQLWRESRNNKTVQHYLQRYGWPTLA